MATLLLVNIFLFPFPFHSHLKIIWQILNFILSSLFGTTEYAYTTKVTEKSDVYSFGVVLMELVTGKKPVDAEFGENSDIVQWVCSKIRNNTSMIDLVDSSIFEGFKEDAVEVLKIAVHCTSRTPALRPSMRMVVHMLEEAEPCKLTNIVVNSPNEDGRKQGLAN